MSGCEIDLSSACSSYTRSELKNLHMACGLGVPKAEWSNERLCKRVRKAFSRHLATRIGSPSAAHELPSGFPTGKATVAELAKTLHVSPAEILHQFSEDTCAFPGVGATLSLRELLRYAWNIGLEVGVAESYIPLTRTHFFLPTARLCSHGAQRGMVGFDSSPLPLHPRSSPHGPLAG